MTYSLIQKRLQKMAALATHRGGEIIFVRGGYFSPMRSVYKIFGVTVFAFEKISGRFLQREIWRIFSLKVFGIKRTAFRTVYKLLYLPICAIDWSWGRGGER